MNTWQNPVIPYSDPGITPTSSAPPKPPEGMFSPSNWARVLGGFWDDIIGIYKEPIKGTEKSAEKAGKQNEKIVRSAPEAARKALGIDPTDWQTFIRQTLADWGIYAGLGVLLLLGLVFLVSAAGGGPPPVIAQRTLKKISGKPT